jgi:hypothetical protein
MLRWRALLIFIFPLVLMGCQGSTIFKKFDIDSGTSISMDAKQRAILVTKMGGPMKDRLVVCAEPSPDALVAQSAAIAAEGGFKGANASLAASLKEAAGSIGIRTTTIQLLRDGLYRACEAYMNGVIDQSEYKLIIRNYDRVMASLFAIDAASGLAQAPTVVINAGGATAKTEGAQNSDGSGGDQPTGATPDAGTGTTTIKIDTPQAPTGGLNDQGKAVILAVIAAIFDEKRTIMPVCLQLYIAASKYPDVFQTMQNTAELKPLYMKCKSVLAQS